MESDLLKIPERKKGFDPYKYWEKIGNMSHHHLGLWYLANQRLHLPERYLRVGAPSSEERGR